MPYTALPDMRIPYDNDGTQTSWWNFTYGSWLNGSPAWVSAGNLLSMQSYDVYAGVGQDIETNDVGLIHFFPEQREVTGFYARWQRSGSRITTYFMGSNDTVNGMDGTWETASMGSQAPQDTNPQADWWRKYIATLSFTGPKRTVKLGNQNANTRSWCFLCHLYGEKAAGQTPDDIIFLNQDDTPGVEYTAAEDFGDQPLGTTVVRQFRVKNTSATKTANTINIQCNDADFAISTDNVNWVVTINLASLAAGAQSPTYYIRCTTPGIGGAIGPRFARIVATVASYT